MKLLKKHFHLALFRHSRTLTCNCTKALTKIAPLAMLRGKNKRKHLRHDESRSINALIGTTNAELYTVDVQYLYYRANLCKTKGVE